MLPFFLFCSETVDYAKFGFDFVKQSNQTGPLFHNIALQQYILLCTQVKKQLISFIDGYLELLFSTLKISKHSFFGEL
jgi:hypothetical protein